MNSNQTVNLLTVILMIMIVILFVLCLIFVILKLKDSNLNKKTNKKKDIKSNTNNDNNTSIAKSYNKQSIMNFMDFDKIEDNMIIQKNGKRFLMVIECQGINYDLMSGLEKNSVEQGFLQFLNTLRYPIQIYIQTRTVNLSNSINTYKSKIEDISKQLASKQVEYNEKVRSGRFSQEQLDKEKYEIIRQKNLYEYGVDIVSNTERMSFNKNILSKHYYVIIPYYSEDLGNTDFDKEEIKNIAFSELYTKAQAIINSLAVCSINSKILDSTGLAELLYVAYNRDESEVYNLQRALNSGYDDLYSTAPDVLDKRMRELDRRIEEEAIRKANKVVEDVIHESEKERRIKEREKNLDDLIDIMTKSIIDENKDIIGKEVARKAKDKIDTKKLKREGGELNEKRQKTATRRRVTKESI